jgi:predicted RNA-binding protein with PIN domain
VDGYNLLFVSGSMGKVTSANDLARSRNRVLDLMLEYLPPNLANRTIVVFDAPRHGRSEVAEESKHGDMQVVFAKQHPEADDLIEEMIRNHPQPRRLTVVSGDQRIRVAARHRRVKDIDSESWWTHLETRHAQANRSIEQPESGREKSEPDDDDTDWLEVFS